MKTDFRKFIIAALFAALCCVLTMSVRIPTLGTGGYIHPGDAMVILTGIFLGPGFGFLAAGLGSAMADLLGGYFIYVPITFVIKGLVALVAALVFKRFAANGKQMLGVLLGGVGDVVIVATGYFLCESVLYGAAASALSIPGNIIQGVSGLLISAFLYPILARIIRSMELTARA